MNAEPFRLRLLKNLTAVLQTITLANGYNFDLDKSIFRGRAVFGKDDPVPMVSILEAVKTIEVLQMQFDGQEQKNVWSLLVQGWTDDDLGGNPTDPAYLLLADVKKAITKHKLDHARDYNWFDMDGRVSAIRYNGGVVRPAEEIVGKSFFWLLLDLELVEDLLNPYA